MYTWCYQRNITFSVREQIYKVQIDFDKKYDTLINKNCVKKFFVCPPFVSVNLCLTQQVFNV